MKENSLATPHSLGGDDGDRLVDERALSRIVGLSVSTLRKNRMAGRGFPFLKLGTSVRYSLRDAREEIERSRRMSTTDTTA